MLKYEFAPVNTGYAHNGIYDQRILDFHSKRSGKYICFSCIGNVAISLDRTTNVNTAVMCEQNFSIFAQLAEIIRCNGSLAVIQIASRFSSIRPQKEWNSSASNHIAIAQQELNSLKSDIITQEIDKICKASIKLANIGFDYIQIHAAHGYFLSRMFNRKINKRTDMFSFGNIEWLNSLIGKIKARSSAKVDIRLNIRDGIETEHEEFQYKFDLISKIATCGVDKISLTNGFYDINKNHIYPKCELFASRTLDFAKNIAFKHSETLFSVAGNMMAITHKLLELPPNLYISIGRPLIADPAAIEKLYENKPHICDLCNLCHYYSIGKSCLECPKW